MILTDVKGMSLISISGEVRRYNLVDCQILVNHRIGESSGDASKVMSSWGVKLCKNGLDFNGGNCER